MKKFEEAFARPKGTRRFQIFCERANGFQEAQSADEGVHERAESKKANVKRYICVLQVGASFQGNKIADGGDFRRLQMARRTY